MSWYLPCIYVHIYIMHCYKDLSLVVLRKICAWCSMLLMRYILGHLLLNSTTMVNTSGPLLLVPLNCTRWSLRALPRQPLVLLMVNCIVFFLFRACMRVLFIRSLNTAYAVEIGAMYHYDLQHALPRIVSSLHLGEILSQIYEATRNLALDCQPKSQTTIAKLIRIDPRHTRTPFLGHLLYFGHQKYPLWSVYGWLADRIGRLSAWGVTVHQRMSRFRLFFGEISF
jgi:hypothetical protein